MSLLIDPADTPAVAEAGLPCGGESFAAYRIATPEVPPLKASHTGRARVSTIAKTIVSSLCVLASITALALLGRAWLAARARALTVKPGESTPCAVRATTLQSETVRTGLRYSAAVHEIERLELSFRVGGTVEDLYRVEGVGGRRHHLHEGDRVASGAALAWLDTADYRRERAIAAERLATARAKLIQLESDAELAEIELRRIDWLVDRKAAADAEFDTARSRQRSTAAAVAGARRDVQSAQLALEQSEANLTYCKLASPLPEATVAARYINAGERVTAGQKAFLLLDLSSVVIAFGVPDTLVNRLALGQPLDVTCDALPGERFTGLIHKIASAADPKTRTYAIEVRIDEPRGLRPGMIATVHVERDQRAYLLPLSAVMHSSEQRDYQVFRLTEEAGQTVVRRVPVALDDVIDNRIAVNVGAESALQPGDRVVTTGTHRLYDGQPVAIED